MYYLLIVTLILSLTTRDGVVNGGGGCQLEKANSYDRMACQLVMCISKGKRNRQIDTVNWGLAKIKRLWKKVWRANMVKQPQLSLCATFFKNVTIGYNVYIVVPFCHIAPAPNNIILRIIFNISIYISIPPIVS